MSRLHIRFPRKPYCHFNLLYVCHRTANAHKHIQSPSSCCRRCEYEMSTCRARTHSHLPCTLILIILLVLLIRECVLCVCVAILTWYSLFRASPPCLVVCMCVCAVWTVALLWTIKWLDFVCETNVFETMGTYLLKGWISVNYYAALPLSLALSSAYLCSVHYYSAIPYCHHCVSAHCSLWHAYNGTNAPVSHIISIKHSIYVLQL